VKTKVRNGQAWARKLACAKGAMDLLALLTGVG